MIDRANLRTHYDLLRVRPTASPQEIRRAYRDLSKLYHPDTTDLPPEIATPKFQALNEAYATLSSPEKRLAYDYSIGYSPVTVMQAPAYLDHPASERSRYEGTSAYLDPTDRPLSPGEIFALFILGVTFVGCLLLVFTIGFTQGNITISVGESQAAPVVEMSTSSGQEKAVTPSETGDRAPNPQSVQPDSAAAP